jgi:hypothetical protein
MFDETYSQRDGILTRQDNPSFAPADTSQWVVSGPHFFVGTPLNKTPRTRCNSKGAYDDIELCALDAAYLPRSVYRPGNKDGDIRTFLHEIPSFDKQPIASLDFWLKWHQSICSKSIYQAENLAVWFFCLAYQCTYQGKKPLTIKYRFFNRRRASLSTERSFISSILPMGVTHIDSCLSTTFEKISDLLVL